MILLTGSNGFLGNVILKYLSSEKKEVFTLSKKNANLNIDLSLEQPTFNHSFTLVIHAAGKAHSVPRSILENQEFFNVNLNGTKNLLNGLMLTKHLPKAFVYISSVSVYNKEMGDLINENTPLLASDPYGKSKIAAEKLISEWCLNQNIICTILRLPLIAGPNSPGNLGAMIKGIKKGYYFNIDNGKAKKSIVLAEDIANIILKASEIGGIFNLTDGYHPSFKELSTHIAKELNKNEPRNIHSLLAIAFALIGDIIGKKAPINSNKLKKITSNLTFDDSKARKLLGWNPTSVLEGFRIN